MKVRSKKSVRNNNVRNKKSVRNKKKSVRNKKKSLRNNKFLRKCDNDGVKQCPNCKKFELNDEKDVCMRDECKRDFPGESDIFHIYTTGILDSGNVCSILNVWKNNVRRRIIDKIKPHYKTINIHHYDMHPIDNISKLFMDQLNLDENSNFVNEKLNLDIIQKNHIIVDFAHIFKYIKPGHVRLNEYILEVYDTEYKKKEEELNLNVIYFGYIGEKQITDKGFSCSYIVNNDEFLEIKKDRKIVTYIDKLFFYKKNPREEIISPDLLIQEKFDMVRDEVLIKILKIAKPYDLVFNENQSQKVVSSIIENMKTEIPFDNILNNVIKSDFSYLLR